jgi:hypothetical protein
MADILMLLGVLTVFGFTAVGIATVATYFIWFRGL